MGLFRKLFGGDVTALVEKAERSLAAGEFGAAKLGYEKAAHASSGEAREALLKKVGVCCDAIARGRLEVGRRHLERGAGRLALEEFEGAREVASEGAIRLEAQALIDGIDQREAVAQATVSHHMTDEERIAVLIGQWEEAQASEYEGYGEGLFDGVLLLQKERFEEAAEQLERLLQEAEAPRYLWLEVARARLLTGRLAEGKEALTRFIGALGSGEGGEARISAHLELARLCDEDGGFEEAMAHFEAAVEGMPNDYRPYLAMGAFLREKEHAGEALEVLQTALELCTTTEPDWRLLQELGLTCAQQGDSAAAVGYLEQVVSFFAAHQVTDLPVPTATTLARLHEEAGRLERAADMYRALSSGTDQDNHGVYHYEAGRLLQRLGLTEEGHRMLSRALALATEDEVLRAKVEALVGES